MSVAPSPLRGTLPMTIIRTVCLFVATVGLVTGHGPVTEREAATSFVEADGVVSIEAEHHSRRIGPWQLVEGRNAVAAGFGIVPEYRLHAIPSALTPMAAASLEWPRQFPVAWGHPTGAAVSALVTDVDRSRSAMFAYDAGARMHGLVAPARGWGCSALGRRCRKRHGPGWTPPWPGRSEARRPAAGRCSLPAASRRQPMIVCLWNECGGWGSMSASWTTPPSRTSGRAPTCSSSPSRSIRIASRDVSAMCPFP